MVARYVPYAFPDPTSGSPRQNTGAEEVTPRGQGFMFSLRRVSCFPYAIGTAFIDGV